MKMRKLIISLCLFVGCTCAYSQKPPIYIAFQWHMHQPIYVPGETVTQTHNAGRYSYNLYDIFYTRTGPYTSWPSNAVNKLISAGFQNAGAQVSFSGSLISNLNTMESNGAGFSNWKSNWNSMTNKKTALGNQRLEMVGFGYYHPLMPLTDNADIRKQIQAHKAILASNFPGMPYSKGIFPPENAFESHIIPALVAEGLQWVMVDNMHFDRACIGHPWGSGGNIVESNNADKVNPNPNDWKQINGLWAPIQISAGWGHRPHWLRYIDPETGNESKIIAVPTSAYYGNEDGRGGFGALDYENTMSQLESYNTDPNHPILIVLHHDGDNYGGGADYYYESNFNKFVDWLKSKSSRFVCTTIQDYLSKFPPANNDLIHVEAGSWSGAGGDPIFLKWNGDPGSYMGSSNYSPDHNSWGVITAASNIVKTAEQINPSSSNVKDAWDYLTMGETSCYWYWDGSENGFWDAHPTRAANLAVNKAISIVNSGLAQDKMPPSIYHPQRKPYNPGGTEWGKKQSSDFNVWTYVFDISGLSTVKLKYRTNKEGFNLLNTKHNQTYAGGSDVNAWQELTMTKKTIPPLAPNVSPAYKADEYSAMIQGLTDVLVDYYVEATDSRGNIAKSPIQHVYVGASSAVTPGGHDLPSYIQISPAEPTINDEITVELLNSTAATVFHWGVNDFTKPIQEYLPAGSSYHSDGIAVRTSFVNTGGKYQLKIGPFNNSKQAVSYISFVINKTGSNEWDNNGGQNYRIKIAAAAANDNPKGANIDKTLNANASYTFTVADFGFNSPKGNTFKGIKILSLPASGSLKVNGSAATVNQTVTNVTQIIYTIGTQQASFTYKIVDNQDLESDATYTATFKIYTPEPAGIKVRFKKPSNWTTVNVYGWKGSDTKLTGEWPGAAATNDGDGWYSYIFNPSETNVNVVFSSDKNPQTVDIKNITTSTCFEEDGKEGDKVKVKTVSCPMTSIENGFARLSMLVYHSPMRSQCMINLPDMGDNLYRLSIYDLSGRKVASERFEGSDYLLQRNNLNSGIYVLEVLSENGAQIYKSKLVVK